jgi:hypothetical protein
MKGEMKKEPIFVLYVYAPEPPAMSKAIEANIIRRAMQLAAQSFGSGVGGKIAGEIVDGYNLETAEKVVLGHFRYTAHAPA